MNKNGAVITPWSLVECMDAHSKQISTMFIELARKKLRRLCKEDDPRKGGIIYSRNVSAFLMRLEGSERYSYGVSADTIL